MARAKVKVSVDISVKVKGLKVSVGNEVSDGSKSNRQE